MEGSTGSVVPYSAPRLPNAASETLCQLSDAHFSELLMLIFAHRESRIRPTEPALPILSRNPLISLAAQHIGDLPDIQLLEHIASLCKLRYQFVNGRQVCPLPGWTILTLLLMTFDLGFVFWCCRELLEANEKAFTLYSFTVALCLTLPLGRFISMLSEKIHFIVTTLLSGVIASWGLCLALSN